MEKFDTLLCGSLTLWQPHARDDAFTFPLDDLELSWISDQELTPLFFTAPKLHDFRVVSVVRLSKTLAAKGGPSISPVEAQNMLFALESLSLPVPKVHRTLMADMSAIANGSSETGFIIVMDYIEGQTVDECWNSLALDQQESVVSQIAAIIESMQSKTLKLPTRPIGKVENEKFQGPWFTHYGAGTFATIQDLENWYSHKIDICLKFKKLSRRVPRFRFRRLVFTNQDIAPRNLILDRQGKVWMIVWGSAGAYPPGFEQAVLELHGGGNVEFSELVLARLFDRHEKLSRQLFSIGYGFSVAALI